MAKMLVVFEYFTDGTWKHMRETCDTLDIDVRPNDGRVIVYTSDNGYRERFEPCRFVTARAE
jgi:hypothetical protein